MIAKCTKTEKEGRKVFYGAMISESVIALVQAAAGVLGAVGGVLAIAGVVICPITSEDTEFCSARLILAETFRLEQKKPKI